MKKLEKLSEQQITLMNQVRDSWLNRFLGCQTELNRDKAIELIKWLYKESTLKEPIVFLLNSPLACQLAANLLKRDQIGDQIGSQVWAQVRSQVRAQVWAQVRSQVWDQVRSQIGDQVRDQIGDQVWDQVGSQVWDQIGDQVRSQVRAQVWDQVESQVGSQVESQVGSQVWAQVRDQVWAQVRDQVGSQVRAQVGSQVWAQVGSQVWAQVWAQVGSQVWAQVESQVGSQVWDQVESQVGSQVWAQVRDQIGSQVRAQVRDQVGSQVGSQVWAQVRDQVWAQVWAQVGSQVRDQVRDQVWDQVESQVGSQVWDQVWDQVRSQIGDQKIEYFSFSNYGSIWDYGWVAFYDFFNRTGIFQHEGFDQFRQLLETGVYDMIQLDGLCIACSLPNRIIRNASNRLHSEDGPAISWKDGYELHFWNGVAVSKRLIETPDSITREDILAETNAERRRCMMEKLGSVVYGELLGLIELDSDVDGQGNPQTLYRTREKDELAEDYLYFAKVVCPSTNRNYYLCVPPMDNVWSAVSWTFGKTKDTYSPLIET